MARNPLLFDTGPDPNAQATGPGTWRPGQRVNQLPDAQSFAARGPGTWRPGQLVDQPPTAPSGNPLLRATITRAPIDIPVAPRPEPRPDIVKWEAPPYPRAVMSAYPSRPIGGYDWIQSAFWNTGTIIAGEVGVPLVMKFPFGGFAGYTWTVTGFMMQAVNPPPLWTWAGIILNFQNQRNSVPIFGADGWQWYGDPGAMCCGGDPPLWLVFDAPDTYTLQCTFLPTAAQLGQSQIFNVVAKGTLIPSSGFPYRNDIAHPSPVDVAPTRKPQ